MQYMNGFYFCHTPIVFPEKHYDCEHFISIKQIPDEVPEEELYNLLRTGTPEWNKCVKIIEIKEFEHLAIRSATLKQEVIDWLNKNIADSTDKTRSDMPQGWMIYDPQIVHQTTELSVFFLRRKDAMHFKLVWS